MIPYLVLLTIICTSGLLFYGKKKNDKAFLLFSAILTILFQSVRAATVGVDTPVYYNGFQIIRQLDWESCNVYNWEILYAALNWIIGQFTQNFNILLLVVSVLVVGNIWYFIYKNSENVFWSVFLFFTLDYFFMSMYSIRQYCAISIGINIYTVLKQNFDRKNIIKAICLLLLALGFHNTAFVCVAFFVPFILKKVDAKTILLLAVATVLVILSFSQIMGFLFQFFPKYAMYQSLGSDKFAGAQIRNIDLIFTFFKIVSFLVVSRFNPDLEKNQELYRLLFVTAISIGLSFLVTRVELMWRFTYYFDIFLIILIPDLLQRLKRCRTIGYYLVLVFGVLYFIYIMILNGGQCVPYQTCWS